MAKYRNLGIAICTFFALTLSFLLSAQHEKDVAAAWNRVKTAEKANKFERAAKAYKAVELYSNHPEEKAKALLGAARNYRKAGFFGEELDCLLRLTREHITRIDFGKVISRMYQIGDEFFDGHHDLVVKWLPFIYDEDRMVDAYENAIRLAPCAAEAPRARLRLAIYHQENGKPLQAIDEYREIMRLHPDTKIARSAYMQLAHLYYLLVKNGDGDGRWSRLAIEQLDKFIAAYPGDPEIPWAKQTRDEIDAVNAKRLHGLAEYYHRTGQDAVAQRYLARVIRDYGSTENAVKSEKLLAKLDKTYTPPPAEAPRKENFRIKIERNTIPTERAHIMIAPENSNGRFLLPVRDLELNRVRDSRDDIPERPFTDDDI